MFSARFTQALLHGLDRFARKNALHRTAPHLVTGQRGEEAAYFYLRRRGYTIIARNFRSSRHRGEIDLIAWDKDVLCFIEVKTRTTREVKPAEAAVDRKKRRDLRVMIRYYLRTLPRRNFPKVPQWRFDIVTVHYDGETSAYGGKLSDSLSPRSGKSGPPRETTPTFELFQNVALSS
ncbi:MAG TPA: YraN family protein [Terriglobales bacterium]|nr:YraN family protein [Terriglobales bacterium]